MNIFYNQKTLGDVLLVQVTTDRPKETEIDSVNDITLIKDESSKEVVAFNVFNASKYVEINGNGQIETTEEIVGKLNEALKSNGVELELDVDLSPKFVVGYVIEKEKHPNADKLSVCTVDVGNEKLQIVCGAPNVDKGQKVVVAKVGAVMPSGMVIRDAELRGIASSGMICSARELNLPDAPAEKGILVLREDSRIGEPFNI
ncbi:YtpR family tRNA-binding protein [Sporosarcina sp. FSL W8-0480]|uniref:YtpR family tRNA-binding protein n=1 Tax=Sporosarcina sp. FSL W8-0480 TaxID=2954701 RepID=UPI0030D9FB60